jgi:hypothetical protein
MQNQGIAQVEPKGRTEPELNVIRVVLCQDWWPGLRPSEAGKAQSGAIGGNSETFPGSGAGGLTGRLGMHKPSPINAGAAAIGRQKWALRLKARLVPGCLDALL